MTDWFDRVPKSEIHLHLEGAIPHAALWELVEKYGGDPSVPRFEDLQRRFEYRDFAHFLDVWAWKNGFLREYEDFEFIAERIAQDFVRQNIRYVEAFYSPADFSCHGLETRRLTGAIRSGLDRVQGVEIALIADVVRNYGPEQAAATAREVDEAREFGVIGIGLGGAEHEFPAALFRDVYRFASDVGFHTTAHAGEAAGATSVRSAIEDLGVERIGHGVRAAGDEALLDRLAHRRLPLEMCPVSNLRTGVVEALHRHPIREFFERGILVTVNTDDPAMFGNSLAEEYRLLEQQLGFSRDEVRQLILDGIEASWLPRERKQLMKKEFQADPAWSEPLSSD